MASALFHAQQAGEKALKALLAWHDEPFRKTHNLEELGRQAVAFDATLRPLVDRAGGLTKEVRLGLPLPRGADGA